MSSRSVTIRGRIIATAAILLLAALSWTLGNRVATAQPVSVDFRPVSGSAEVQFLPQPWGNSPICSCNGGWKGIGVPADQFDLDVDDGKKPWTVMVGPIDRAVPANWWLNPGALTSPLSITVTQGGKQIAKMAAPAGITIESSGSPIGIFTKKSSFSAVIPAEGATTSLRSEPMMANGDAAGISSVKVKSPTAPESSSDFESDGTYIGAHQNGDADVAGSNFRSTMIDTLGPRIDLTLGTLPNSKSPPGTYRLWVGDREIELLSSGDVEVSIRTDFAVRLRPLPLNYSQVIGDSPVGSKLVLPQVTQAIPSHTTSLTNAFAFGGDSWDNSVEMAKSSGPPIELPDTPSLYVYGSLSQVESTAMQGTVTTSDSADIAPGDRLEVTSSEGFDFTTEPLLLLAATTERISESQYFHGEATGSLHRSGRSSGLDGTLEKLRGPSVTRTRWLINLTPFIAAFAGFFTLGEAMDAFARARETRKVPSAGLANSAPRGSSPPSVSRRPGGANLASKPKASNRTRKRKRRR